MGEMPSFNSEKKLWCNYKLMMIRPLFHCHNHRVATLFTTDKNDYLKNVLIKELIRFLSTRYKNAKGIVLVSLKR